MTKKATKKASSPAKAAPKAPAEKKPTFIDVKEISELRFKVEGTDTIFYLDEQHPPGKYILRVWQNVILKE